MPQGRNRRRRTEDTWDDEAPSRPSQAPTTITVDANTPPETFPEEVTPRSATTRRRREDTWDSEAPSMPGQRPAEIPADETTPPEPPQVTATPRSSPTWRRREDTWDPELPAQLHTDSSANSPLVSPRRASRNRAPPSNSSGLVTWNEMLDGSEASSADEYISREEQVRLPRFQEASPWAPPQLEPAISEQVRLRRFREASQPAPAPSSIFQEAFPISTRPNTSSQARRALHRSDTGLLFQPYRAPPAPRSLEEVGIPDRGELALMEEIHGTPRPMPDHVLYHFSRGYGVPPDIASDMRSWLMIGVYPSGLVYLNFHRLSNIPTQWHRRYGEVPVLYWARILYLKQGDQREHLEHELSKAPGRCRCKKCQYEREQGMMGPWLWGD